MAGMQPPPPPLHHPPPGTFPDYGPSILDTLGAEFTELNFDHSKGGPAEQSPQIVNLGGRSKGDAASPSAAVYEAWIFQKANPGPGERPTWGKARRNMMPVKSEELEKKLKKQKNASSAAAKQYSKLKELKQAQIDRLLADKSQDENNPLAEWTLVFLKTEERIISRTSKETLSMEVIIKRQLRKPPKGRLGKANKTKQKSQGVHAEKGIHIEPMGLGPGMGMPGDFGEPYGLHTEFDNPPIGLGNMGMHPDHGASADFGMYPEPAGDFGQPHCGGEGGSNPVVIIDENDFGGGVPFLDGPQMGQDFADLPPFPPMGTPMGNPIGNPMGNPLSHQYQPEQAQPLFGRPMPQQMAPGPTIPTQPRMPPEPKMPPQPKAPEPKEKPTQPKMTAAPQTLPSRSKAQGYSRILSPSEYVPTSPPSPPKQPASPQKQAEPPKDGPSKDELQKPPAKESAESESPKIEPPKIESPKVESADESSANESSEDESSEDESPEVELPKVEPQKTESAMKEPAKIEPPQSEPPKFEPPKTESLKSESLKTESPKINPSKTALPKTEPPQQESSKQGPRKPEPRKPEILQQEEPKKEEPRMEEPPKPPIAHQEPVTHVKSPSPHTAIPHPTKPSSQHAPSVPKYIPDQQNPLKGASTSRSRAKNEQASSRAQSPSKQSRGVQEPQARLSRPQSVRSQSIKSQSDKHSVVSPDSSDEDDDSLFEEDRETFTDDSSLSAAPQSPHANRDHHRGSIYRSRRPTAGEGKGHRNSIHREYLRDQAYITYRSAGDDSEEVPEVNLRDQHPYSRAPYSYGPRPEPHAVGHRRLLSGDAYIPQDAPLQAYSQSSSYLSSQRPPEAPYAPDYDGDLDHQPYLRDRIFQRDSPRNGYYGRSQYDQPFGGYYGQQ